MKLLTGGDVSCSRFKGLGVGEEMFAPILKIFEAFLDRTLLKLM